MSLSDFGDKKRLHRAVELLILKCDHFMDLDDKTL